MPYIVKLCYLPQLNNTSYYFTQPILVDRQFAESGYNARNISFRDDTIMVTIDDTLGGTIDSNLFKSDYNCLLLYNDNYKYFEVYRVTNIKFIGGKKIEVQGLLTNYTIDKIETDYNDREYILNRRESLNGKCGYIKRGYAYDSILNSNGTANLDGVGKTDIYKAIPYNDINILKFRKNLKFRSVYDGSEPDDSYSSIIEDNYTGWVYVYCEPNRTYTVNENEITVPSINFLTTYNEYLKLPYGVIVMPLGSFNNTSGNPSFSFTLGGVNKVPDINNFISENAPYIYSVKFSSMPPIYFEKSQFTTASPGLGYSVIQPDNDNNIGANKTRIKLFSTGDTTCCMVLYEPMIDGIETLPVLPYELQDIYPSGFGGVGVTNRVSKEDFEDYNKNPYTKAHGTIIRISDGFGGVVDYSPFELGYINDGFVFKYYEPLTPDITKIYIVPKLTASSKGLLSYENEIGKTYIGLINDVDLQIPYSVDLWKQFLANNKNFWLQNIANASQNLLFGTAQGVVDLVVGGVGQSPSGITSGSKKITNAITESGTTALNLASTYANLKSAPDKLNKVKSNLIWLYMIQQNIKPKIEIYTASEYSLKSAFINFCEYGMNLEKYVSEDEVSKYINITDNLYDKVNYKYVEGDITLLDINAWYLRQQRVLERNIKNGIKLIDIQTVVDELPLVEYTAMTDIREEEFNFG